MTGPPNSIFKEEEDGTCIVYPCKTCDRCRESAPASPAGSGCPDIKTWTTDISVYTYWGKGPGKTDRNPELLFERSPKPVKSFRLGIEEKRSGRLIGEVWVYRIEKKRMASVAIRLAAAWQGKGYGTEALLQMTLFCFRNTELQRLWAEVDVRNIASQRMLGKCGYIKEGVIRQGRMINTWCDYCIYGIFASDMTEKTPQDHRLAETRV